MAVPADPLLTTMSVAELVDGVRAQRIRFPNASRPSAAATARVVDSLYRGYPPRPLVLWTDPERPDEPLAWLLDGGDVVEALLRVVGALAEGATEPIYLDTDTGEIVAWAQRPDPGHVTVRVSEIADADIDEVIDAHHLTGRRAQRVRDLARTVHRVRLPVQHVHVPRSDLPRLLDTCAGAIPGPDDPASGWRTSTARPPAWRRPAGHPNRSGRPERI